MCRGDALLEVLLGVGDVSGPQFGDAKVDQRQRAQKIARSGCSGLRDLGRSEKPPRLFHGRRQVASLLSEREAQEGEPDFEPSAPVGGHRPGCCGGPREILLRLLQ